MNGYNYVSIANACFIQLYMTCFIFNLAARGVLRFFVVTSTGVITLIMHESETIREVKELIERRYGIPADIQYLTFHGTLLEDVLTLGDYGVEEESKMYMIIMKTPPRQPFI